MLPQPVSCLVEGVLDQRDTTFLVYRPDLLEDLKGPFTGKQMLMANHIHDLKAWIDGYEKAERRRRTSSQTIRN